jgi:D-glycero-alpha-D-manno-heptose-7-phosphate kinase
VILSRAPFRITLAGGGTDLPAFYKKHGSTFLSCAINKYVYVGLRERDFEKDVRLQYLDVENVSNVSLLLHNRAKACLQLHGFQDSIEIVSSADLSARSGMGSSGSYIVALLNCIRKLRGLSTDPSIIADEACRIEMEILNEPVGKQDQYIASYGSITKFAIDTQGNVSSSRLNLPEATMKTLENNCMIFYTGVLRDASSMLSSQQKNITQDDSAMMSIQKIGIDTIDAIEAGYLDDFGKLMHEHWLQKKKLCGSMSTDKFESIYENMITSGHALGGKIIGAGGGGFLMLYVTENHDYVESMMKKVGLPRMTWKVSHDGVKTCSW